VLSAGEFGLYYCWHKRNSLRPSGVTLLPGKDPAAEALLGFKKSNHKFYAEWFLSSSRRFMKTFREAHSTN